MAFGGSYGGMLTAWFRMKLDFDVLVVVSLCVDVYARRYPNVVIGGLAASAPFGFYGTGLVRHGSLSSMRLSVCVYVFVCVCSLSFTRARSAVALRLHGCRATLIR